MRWLPKGVDPPCFGVGSMGQDLGPRVLRLPSVPPHSQFQYLPSWFLPAMGSLLRNLLLIALSHTLSPSLSLSLPPPHPPLSLFSSASRYQMPSLLQRRPHPRQLPGERERSATCSGWLLPCSRSVWFVREFGGYIRLLEWGSGG